MVDAASTQGSKFQFSKQDTFGTPQTTNFLDTRVEGTPSAKTPVGEATIPGTVFADPNQNDKPVIIKKAVADAFTIGSLLRQPATPGSNGWFKPLFESGNYQVFDGGDDTTIAGTPTTTSVPVTDDNFEAGEVVNIELDNGQFLPTLIQSYATSTIVPMMALPSAAAAGNAVNKCTTISPGDTGQVPDDDLLTIKAFTKAQDGGQDEIILGQDGALTGLSDLSLVPGETTVLEATIGCSDISGDAGTLGSNAFADGDDVTLFHNAYCQFATSSVSAAIAASYQKIMSATFTWGITAEMIAGLGDGVCINDIQGWMQKVVPCNLTLVMLYDSQKLDDFTDLTNESKYIGIIQPGQSAAHPAFGLFLVNAHQVAAPEIAPWTDNEHRVTVQYAGRPAGIGGAVLATDQTNQAWYFGLANQSA